MDSVGKTRSGKVRALALALLFVAVSAIAVGFLGACGTTAAQDSSQQGVSLPAQIHSQVAAFSDGIAAGTESGEETATPNEGQDFPVFEEGVLLASLMEGMTSDQAQAALAAQPDTAAIVVEDQGGGQVKLMFPLTMTTEQAEELLQATELFANLQPNFYYYPMDDQGNLMASTAAAAPLAVGQVDEDAFQGQVDDQQLQTQATPNDPNYGSQWGLQSVNAPAAWDYVAQNRSAGSNDVVIAVIDQGFQANHPDLQDMVAGTYNATNGTTAVGGVATHGTHVAGIVGARSNNGIGVAGTVNNQCKLLLVQVGDSSGSISTTSLENAYRYIEAQRTRGMNIRVANLSLGVGGGPSYDALDLRIYNAISSATNKNIVTVAAAGNRSTQNPTLPYYIIPGDFDNVISVINLEQKSSSADKVIRSDSSNYNVNGQTAKNISAPGTFIVSTYPGSSYASESGTSMASPLVAGVLGLVFTVDPTLRADEAPSRLYSTARDLRYGQFATGWDRQSGYGEVDAAAAVKVGSAVIRGESQAFCGEALTYTVVRGGTVQRGYTWSSSNSAIATVDSTGRFVAKSPGTVTIQAKSGGATLAKTVTVYGISGASSAKSGQTVKYSIAPHSVGTWRWSVNNTAYASINASTGALTVKTGSTATKVTVTVTATAPAGNGLAAAKTLRKQVTLTISAPAAPSKPSTTTVAPAAKQAMYRLFNPLTGEHFYTASTVERDRLRVDPRGRWNYEGIGWYAPASNTGRPVYRLCNPVTGDHHYTMYASERDDVVNRLKWRYEGIGWYSESPSTGAPLYRLFHPNMPVGAHHYTLSAAERSDCINKKGWRGEGLAWYACR